MRDLRALGALTVARMRLLWREPEAVFWVFIFPVVLALVLGLAFQGRGPEPSRIGVVGADAPCIQVLEADAMIELQIFESAGEAAIRLRSGAIDVLVDCDGEEPQLHYDTARTESVAARLRVRDALERAAGRADVLEIREREVTERGSRYIDFLLPGLLGMNLMGTGIWGTGFGIVEWRQKKLLKLFMVTPMRRSSFMLASLRSRGAVPGRFRQFCRRLSDRGCVLRRARTSRRVPGADDRGRERDHELRDDADVARKRRVFQL
jgi:hypothetical protein